MIPVWVRFEQLLIGQDAAAARARLIGFGTGGFGRIGFRCVRQLLIVIDPEEIGHGRSLKIRSTHRRA